ncbi:putative regulator of Ras-like GTPase activity (Roadblock/LC7/MglB family) [Micromonospora pisi]|uniref:Putative regulator of Ras-like GTPase activity (Roadblock/LC7/MglB family) n=1 Tax=Micromonospora pisi TaxID=589240 RepID=A0A495JC53_9ACTN|nr:putative regulator of Ras-like GTPase activity (Roadblock/LC7/MglB family) [Micromonospora pisi]
MVQKTASTADLTWLLDDLVGRVTQAEHAIVLSVDGLLVASSKGLGRDDGEHLAAMASGIQSLARGAGRRFGGGTVQQTIIEMSSQFLFVTAAGRGACLAVLANEDADVGLIAYEMAMLVTRAGKFLASPAREGGPVSPPVEER